jgi:hypothetical protein
MRLIMCVFLAVATLAACDGEQTRRQAPSIATTVATTPVMPTTSSTVRLTTSTSTPEEEDGSEAISVTDRVTIVITNPEDG